MATFPFYIYRKVLGHTRKVKVTAQDVDAHSSIGFVPFLCKLAKSHLEVGRKREHIGDYLICLYLHISCAHKIEKLSFKRQNGKKMEKFTFQEKPEKLNLILKRKNNGRSTPQILICFSNSAKMLATPIKWKRQEQRERQQVNFNFQLERFLSPRQKAHHHRYSSLKLN